MSGIRVIVIMCISLDYEQHCTLLDCSFRLSWILFHYNVAGITQ